MKTEHIDCKTCGKRVSIRSKNGDHGYELIAFCHGMTYVEIPSHKPSWIETMEFLIKAAHIPKDAETVNDWHPKTPAQIEEDARVDALIVPDGVRSDA